MSKKKRKEQNASSHDFDEINTEIEKAFIEKNREMRLLYEELVAASAGLTSEALTSEALTSAEALPLEALTSEAVTTARSEEKSALPSDSEIKEDFGIHSFFFFDLYYPY